jgi:tRNA nucleotidyltransferase (CCA-adding enzyme)
LTELVRTISPPPEVVEIAKTLEEAGFETWCVGGAVRDALLGLQHLDWDLATAAKPPEVRRLFRRTIPIGAEFGTIAVLDKDGVKHEVTTFRRDVQTDGRHAVVEFGASLDEDLARRDFTINALAFSPTRGIVHDPFGGTKDLERGVVRAVGKARDRMREDWLRALRALRFAARYDFKIDSKTWDAVVESAPFLSRLSAERVKQEIEKTMEQVRCPGHAFALWRDAGALGALAPAIAGISAETLDALDALPMPRHAGHSRRRTIRLTALFSAVAAERVPAVLRALRFSNTDIKWMADVIQRWAVIDPEMSRALTSPAGASDADLRRWAAACGRTRLAYVLRLGAAYWAARRKAGGVAPTRERVASVYRRAVRIAYRDPIEIGDLAVDGSDLERLGLSGPAIGRALQRLLSVVVEDPSMNTVERLTELAASEAAAEVH